MTRELVKKLLPIIKAFAEGKAIQFRTNNRPWVDLVDNDLEINVLFEYRIKPEPKYRPFKTQKECWQEMNKHQPFGWVKGKYNKNKCLINEVSCNCVNVGRISALYVDAFTGYEFLDGTPFGIKEE